MRGRARGPSLLWRLVFVAYAFPVLAGIEIRLRCRLPLPTVCARLGIALGADPHDSPRPVDLPWADVHRTVSRTFRLLRYWPWGDTCLRRCLVAGAVLRDLEPELVIGVRRDDAGAILAHSWLRIGGRSVDVMSEDFASFAGR